MIISFGYKHGVPRQAHEVFDVRDLSHDPNSQPFLEKYQEIVDYGRAHPNEHLAIGCDLGKHRSVVMANRVGTALRTSVYHRDK